MHNIVAVIPARKGSQEFRNKNLADYKGHSLIAQAVNVAIESKIFSQIIVTTDYSQLDLTSSDLLHLHVRSESAASSDASALDVLLDLESCFECSKILRASLVCYLQPTSPLRTASDLQTTLDLALENESSRVVSLCRKPITMAKLVSLSGSPSLVRESSFGAASLNRQSANDLYQPNGSIFWFRFNDAIESHVFPIDGASPYFMSIINSIDIDSTDDYREILQTNGEINDVNSDW